MMRNLTGVLHKFGKNLKDSKYIAIMAISEIEKHFLLVEAYYEAEDYIRQQYDDTSVSDFFQLVFSSLTKEESEELARFRKTMIGAFNRRRYEVTRFRLYNKEGKELLEKMYPDIPPIVDFDYIPFKTFQVGMYVFWVLSIPQKGDEYGREDETDEEFERRKDWHDYLFGYVNQDAILDPLIDIKELIKEFAKQREIITNYVRIIVQNRNK